MYLHTGIGTFYYVGKTQKWVSLEKAIGREKHVRNIVLWANKEDRDEWILREKSVSNQNPNKNVYIIMLSSEHSQQRMLDWNFPQRK